MYTYIYMYIYIYISSTVGLEMTPCNPTTYLMALAEWQVTTFTVDPYIVSVYALKLSTLNDDDDDEDDDNDDDDNNLNGKHTSVKSMTIDSLTHTLIHVPAHPCTLHEVRARTPTRIPTPWLPYSALSANSVK